MQYRDCLIPEVFFPGLNFNIYLNRCTFVLKYSEKIWTEKGC